MGGSLLSLRAIRADGGCRHADPRFVGRQFRAETRAELRKDPLGLTRETRNGRRNFRRLSTEDRIGRPISDVASNHGRMDLIPGRHILRRHKGPDLVNETAMEG